MGVAAVAIVRRWLIEVVLVAAVMAVLVGGALSAAAGARRSSTAVDRFLAFSPPEDVLLIPPDDGSLDVGAVNRLPQVAVAVHQSYLAMTPVGPDGEPQLDLVGSINPFLYAPIIGPVDGIGRRRVVKGRDLNLDEPFEVVIDEELASDRHLKVGSHLTMAAYSGAQLDEVLAPGGQDQEHLIPAGPVLDLTVVGIVRTPADIHPGEGSHTTSYGGTKDIYLTPALYDRYGRQLATFDPPVDGAPEAIRLVHGAADLDEFTRAVRALPGGTAASLETGGSDALDSARTARRAVSVETTALVALTAVLGVAGLVLFAHAAARLARRTTQDVAVLRAIGLRPLNLLAVAACPSFAAAIFGVALAAVVAVVTSPLTPIGLGHEAEIDPGVHFDALIVGGGLLAVLFITLALALLTAVPTVRAARRSATSVVPWRHGLADRLAAIGAPLNATLGAHFATDRRNAARAAPVRSAIVVGATALLVLVAVGTYTASLDHLTSSPADQGVTWDVTIGNPNISAYGGEDVARLASDDHVAAVLPVATPSGRGTINGLAASVAGVDVTGGVGPPVVEGRLPEHAGEVALGRHTAAQLRVRIGDVVAVAFDAEPVSLTVVGTALLNPGLSPTMQIGDGAITTLDDMQTLVPHQPITFLLVRLRPGVDVDQAISALRPTWGRNVSRPLAAVDVVNLDRVKAIPAVLALALGGGAAAMLAFTLVVSVTHRRRDLSVLRALGATSRQIASVVAWQATWLYLAAGLVGVPLGIIIGRAAWRRINDDLGARVTPVVPPGNVLAVVIIGFALALLLALVPAHIALRDRPARSVRTE
jgi:MacB-like periplasmic core domain/FtsX-like permease family